MAKNKTDEDSYIMAVKCIVKIYNDIDYTVILPSLINNVLFRLRQSKLSV